MDEFTTHLAEALDVEALADDDMLDDLDEWDSLGVLSVIAMVESRYGVNLTATALRDVQTPRDLAHVVQAASGS